MKGFDYSKVKKEDIAKYKELKFNRDKADEAIEEYRYDNQGNCYEIQGGEVAIIYPGDLSENGYTTNGIY